jgi:hypothetical protein
MKAALKQVEDHGQQNAASWYSSIAELVAALECDYSRLEELTDENEAAKDLAENSDPECKAEYQQCWADWTKENGDELRELTASATVEGDLMEDADAVRERIQEGPLSVEVRSGWYSPGSDDNAPEEFMILLSTGGPALRLCGDLNEHGEPTRAYLQYQDWGTPWTDYYAGEGSGEVLLTYAQQFCFAA